MAGAEALRVAFEAPDALESAVDDLLDAATADTRPGGITPETEWRLALLATVGEQRGHDWSSLSERFRRALDSTFSQSAVARAELIRRALGTEPDHGRSVVWLVVNHASAWGPSPNPAVELYDGDWLLAVLREWQGPRDGVPDELAADPGALPRAWHRLDEATPPADQLPVVFARIDLGDGPTAGARERARDTLEFLLARAAVKQGGTHWRISDLCLHYADGTLVYESSGPVGNPDVYDHLTRQDVLWDPTAETIKGESTRLRDHLPVSDQRLRRVLELAQWLAEARTAPAPARLVLAGRILEQCAGWAELSPKDLVSEYLLLPWCWTRIAGELSRAGSAAVLRLPGADGTTSSDDERETFLRMSREILTRDDGQRLPVARPWLVLERLDSLREQHDANGEIGGWLSELSGRLADGPKTAAWIDQLLGEAERRHARAVRTRNAIVHGGPLLPAITVTVVGMHDALAQHALNWAMDAQLADEPVSAHFVRRGQGFADALHRLRGNGVPSVELPGPAGERDDQST